MSTKPLTESLTAPPVPAEYLESLGRGLQVLSLFGADGRHRLTMTEAAESLGLTRAAAMRVLMTLEHLGYLRRTGSIYALTARVLSLGYAYLSALGFRAVAQPIADALVADTGETCSIGVLDGADVVYVLRSEAPRIIRIDLAAGSRIPAYLNSMGRLLLSSLPAREFNAYLAALKPVAVTSRTVTSKTRLKQIVARARADGWCYIEGEVEEGVTGIAAPIRDPEGRMLAALNLSLVRSHYSQRRVQQELLPKLLAGARRIEEIAAGGLTVK